MMFGRYWYFFCIFGTGILISYVLNEQNLIQQQDAEKIQFEKAAYDRLTSFSRALDHQLGYINQLSLLLRSEENRSRQRFKDIASPIINANPEIQAVAWVKTINAQDLREHLDRAYKDGLSGYELFQLNQQGLKKSLSEKKDYSPVYYIEPMQIHKAILGLDLSSYKNMNNVMINASSGNVTYFSELTNFITEDRPSILAFSPVYSSDFNIHFSEKNKRNLLGYVLFILDLTELFDDSITNAFADEKIYTGLLDLESDSHIMGELIDLEKKTEDNDYFKNFVIDTGQQVDISVNFRGRLWQLNIAAPRYFNDDLSWVQLNLAIIVGSIISFLVALFLHAQRETTKRIKSEVILKTQELALNEAISRSILDAASDSIISVDENGLISRVNPAFCDLFSYKEDELIGKQLGLILPDCFDSQNGSCIEQMSKDSSQDLMAVDKNDKEIPVQFTISGTGYAGNYQYTCTFHDLTETQRIHGKLEELSITDPLTGLYNRRYFDKKMEYEWSRAQREKTQLSLLMIDVDHFKFYNDSYGHGAGDDCLIAVSEALSVACNRNIDVVARYGGEEFIILMPVCSDAKASAQRCLDSIKSLKITHESSLVSKFITISIGINSIIPDGQISANDFINQTDQALYQAKDNGRNQFCHYTDIST